MTSKEIRQKFLDFFASKNHKIVESAPMVVKDDPTLMFNNAGMNQFKEIFLDNATPKYVRVTNSQKCLRVSGKHNDLEEVGVDTYHHTMFEMLGNWSFGDYFKKEAIEWAWELLTEVYGLDKGRLYITVFEGDKEDATEKDQEAYDIWRSIIPAEYILACDKKDNFWEMGETGPCGPCSEIHIDLRSDDERNKTPGIELVNRDHPQVIEIWNLVFMQYNRMSDRSLVPLKNKHIDTGMGFERLAVALQGKTSNYDTDIFSPLLNKIEDLSGLKYRPENEEKHKQALMVNIAMRVICDHVRAISFSIADGQLPSNTGAGYVIRRILRRAVRYGYQSLELKEPFMYRLVPVLANQMGDAFPELANQKVLIEKVIKEEEASFFRTLELGLKRIDQICIKLNSEKKYVVPGTEVFELYDTFGFPIDLTSLIAEGYKMTIDEVRFNEELEKQKNRSRKDAETDKEEFVGYDCTESEVYITRYRRVIVKENEVYQLVFNFTPFYPEGGGQVGDRGYIEAHGSKTLIFDTKKENNLIIHFTNELPADTSSNFKAVVDNNKRTLTANNHSATHLMHEALREILGTHVEQKGSLVNEKYLRFDFSHFSKVTDAELAKVEALVNSRIRQNFTLEEQRKVPVNKAKEMGAMMLFGEKYGEAVRVIKFGTSIELCGGIHVRNTSQIGTFKITSESSIASGIRRIEAITSVAADKHLQSQLDLIDEVRNLLKGPKDLKKAVLDLLSQNSKLGKEIESYKKDKAGDVKKDLLDAIETINGVNFLAKKVDLDAGAIKDLAFQLKGEVDDLFMILGAETDGKVVITIVLSDSLVKGKKLHAGNMIRDLAKEIGGGGGGQPNFATAGGKNASGIPRALEKAKEYVM
jgi:alanyl-tRNA synthetase